MNDNSIVIADFDGYKTTARTRRLWQWNYGMTLEFRGLALPTNYTVHFANDPTCGVAKKQVGDANGVIIPDEYLTTGLHVYAWIFLHKSEEDGETVYMVEIPVYRRPQPVEDELTPVQQSLIEQAIAALNNAVEQTSEDSALAQEAAQNASQSATNAGYSEQNASQSASNAELYSQNASQSATNAGYSEQNAAQSASEAEAASQAIQDMSVEGETLEPGLEVSVEKTVGPGGVVTLTFGIPQGEQGIQGDSGVYVGSDEPTNDANVWIDPNGTGSIFTAEDMAYDNTDDDISFSAGANDVEKALTAHSQVLVSQTDEVLVTPDFEYKLGYVHGLDYSNPHSSTNTLYSDLKNSNSKMLYLKIRPNYKALVVNYDNDGYYVSTSSWITEDSSVVLSEPKYCIEIRRTDNTSIDVSAGSKVTVSYVRQIMPSKRRVIVIDSDMTEMLSITESCDIVGNGHTIDVGSTAQYALYIEGNIEVNVSDFKMAGGTNAACRVTGYANVNFKNCEFSDSVGSGLSVMNGNTNCVDCISYGNAVDGFNYHNAGKNTAIGCWGQYNGDDGISNHEQSSLKIIGGRYTNNSKAGIACPTYGAGNTDIHGAYVADNAQYGLLIFNETETDEIVYVEGCLILNNPVGARISGYQVIAKGVSFAGNTADTEILSGGSLTEY